MKYMYVYIYIYHRSIETKPLPSFHIKLFHTKCLKGPSCFYHRKVPFVTSMSSLGTSGAWWCPGCLQWRPHLEGRQCCRVNWCTVDPLRKGGRVVKIKVLLDVNQGASGCSNWIPYWFQPCQSSHISEQIHRWSWFLWKLVVKVWICRCLAFSWWGACFGAKERKIKMKFQGPPALCPLSSGLTTPLSFM